MMLCSSVSAILFLSTPSARRATKSCGSSAPRLVFLSTPSARRATVEWAKNLGIYQISIHALREEGDAPTLLSKKSLLYFYPRPPRGGRHYP